jgi:hypothetical protein
MAATPTKETTDYISVDVMKILDSLKNASNDVTLLTSAIYLPTAMSDPFSSDLLLGAVKAVNGTREVNQAVPTVSSATRNIIYTSLVASLGGPLATSTDKDQSIINAFATAGKLAFMKILEARIKRSRPTYNYTTSQLETGGTHTLKDMIELIETALKKKMPFLKSDGTPVAGFHKALAAAEKEIYNAIKGLPFVNNEARHEIFSPSTIAGLVQIAFCPFVLLSYLDSFVESKEMGFVTQMYARWALTRAAMGAITSLSGTYGVGDAEQTTLATLKNSIAQVISASSVDVSSTPIKSIMEKSALIRTTSQQLSEKNARLVNRLGLTRDLQTTFRVDKDGAARRRMTFYAWLVAYVLVLAVSVFLVSTGKLPVFLLLAGATFVVVTSFLLIELGMRLAFGGPSSTRGPGGEMYLRGLVK